MDFSSINSILDQISTPAGMSSLAYGAVFGAIMTLWVFWSASGHLKFPGFEKRAIQVALGLGAFIYFWAIFRRFFLNIIIDPIGIRLKFLESQPNLIGIHVKFLESERLGTTLLTFIATLLILTIVRSPQFREFLSLATLQRLFGTQEAWLWGGAGLASGALIGAISSQILAVPMKHCTFEDGVAARDQQVGLLVLLLSTTFLLVPVWTYVQRGRRISVGNQSTSGYFKHGWVAILLLLPTLIILAVFLYYPAFQVVDGSMQRASVRIGAEPTFVCLDNYNTLLESRLYAYENSLAVTAKITAAVVVMSMALSLMIANLAYQKIRWASIYRTLLIWPYAISPIVAGAIFLVMFNPQVGIVNWMLDELAQIGIMKDLLMEIFGTTRPEWFSNPKLAIWVIVGASVWNILGFNILFYIAGLQSVPEDLLEAASIDGANSIQRFFLIKFPLLSPYTFFLLVTNVTYAFYGIFGVVDRLTQGGPPTPGNSRAGATDVLIYSLYETAFVGTRNKLGIANAQSLILFLFVAGITIIQFRIIEQRVTYSA